MKASLAKGRFCVGYNKKMFNFKILAGLLLVVFLIGISWYFLKKQQPANVQKTLANQILSSPNPTSFPFEDMTIPYLRQKNYQSSLGERTKYQDNGSFTSYLTSYTSDGLKINGLLTIPNTDKPVNGFPAIVFVHGYIPPTQYQTTERYVDYVNYLARNGFVVFKIDLRGNGSSEGQPGGSYYSSDYIIDALNAYSALQNSGFVNPAKIGLWGHSMAGNIVLRSLAAKPDIPVAVIWAGAGYSYTDLIKYGLHDNSYHPPQVANEQNQKRQKLRQLYGNPDPNNWFWQEVAATNYLSDYKGAIQLNHAVDDDVVNIGYSRDLNALLDQTSIPHELHEYSSGGHNITNPSFTPAMQNTVAFFDKYLKN